MQVIIGSCISAIIIHQLLFVLWIKSYCNKCAQPLPVTRSVSGSKMLRINDVPMCDTELSVVINHLHQQNDPPLSPHTPIFRKRKEKLVTRHVTHRALFFCILVGQRSRQSMNCESNKNSETWWERKAFVLAVLKQLGIMFIYLCIPSAW